MVPPESGFGTNVGTHSFYVYKDGEKTTDYSYTLENGSITVTETDDGGLSVTSNASDRNCWITITIDGQSYNFRWTNNPFV